MYYNYIALLFFSVVAIGVPALMLFASRLLRKESVGNPTKNAPYESGEETIGRMQDIDTEYFPFLMIFLPFEILAVFLLLVMPSLYSFSYSMGIALLGLLVIAAAFSLAGYKLISGRRGG
jgi:NADH:ubiquinone oxidoreductase subunit 3 (subunit A)